MFNERNIWSRRRPSTTRPEKYKKLRDMERVPDKPDLTEVGGRLLLYTFNIFSYSISL